MPDLRSRRRARDGRRGARDDRLGIGANTAVFSVVDAVLLRPLPYPAADRLVLLWGARAGQSGRSISVPDLQDWRERNQTLQGRTVVSRARLGT